ncbi:MAG: hypothetical protein KJ902_02475 [Candidatus Omnitrophica bacterium]|nr:hypothetical protein [Candidatus Omnitrophota bacterium]
MKKNKRLSLVVCLLLVAFLCSCTGMGGSSSYSGSSSEPRMLDVSTMLRFKDVPAPHGFNVLEQESFAFQNDVTRVALLKYIGSRPIDEVVLFFKEQMPMYNWSPINIIEYERRILNYEKEGESCIVTIEARGRKSIVTIAISPKSRPMKVDIKEKPTYQ